MTGTMLLLACLVLTARCMAQPHEWRDMPVDEKDLLILKRADAVLSSEDVWDRTDDRTCPPEARVWSLFCALQKASLEVLGTYEHRRAALQEVRFVIEEVTNGRRFEHRLMGYNNLPETSFADIKGVLKLAAERVESRLLGKR